MTKPLPSIMQDWFVNAYASPAGVLYGDMRPSREESIEAVRAASDERHAYRIVARYKNADCAWRDRSHWLGVAERHA